VIRDLVFDIRSEESIVETSVNIKETLATLNQMQADGVIARYAIGGAVAANFYLEPSDTADVDVFVVLNPTPGRVLVSLDSISSYLDTKGFQFSPEGLPVIFGWPVQFLPASKPLLREALEQSIERSIDGVLVRVFTAEHLAAIAFDLGRPKDKRRLDQFREEKALDPSKLSEILKRHGLLERWLDARCD
jgi:hypothetical protein